mgnify:CR=1 FL=1
MNNILEVKNLKKYFSSPKGIVHAVDDVSFGIEAGHTVGVVGESGCGKSTLGKTILRLTEYTSGEVLFEGENVLKASRREMLRYRKEMQMIFQDPFSSLDPRMTVYQSIEEPLRIHHYCKSRSERTKRVEDLMDTVGLARRYINTYPHELDGGRRQRIGVARALAADPEILVLDDSSPALDYRTDLALRKALADRTKDATVIIVAQRISTILHADRILCMEHGEIVGQGTHEELMKTCPTYQEIARSQLSDVELGLEGGKTDV